MVPNFLLGKMVQRYRLICPLPSMTIPDICFPPGFMIIRRKPSLRTPSIRQSPDMELLMPATSTMEASTLQNKSSSHLPDLGSVSCMQNHVQGKARVMTRNLLCKEMPAEACKCWTTAWISLHNNTVLYHRTERRIVL